MLSELPAITTARAAEIVGIGYEGLRSYLKRGLLGRVGMLPGFYAPDAEANDPPAPRAGWTRYGFTDLCLMRVAKILIDAGFSFESANAVVSRHHLWSPLAHDEHPTTRFLLVWPPYADHVIYDREGLKHLADDVEKVRAQGAFTLVNLGDVQRHVRDALGASPGL